MSERRNHDAGLERLLHDLEDGNLSAEGWRTLEARLVVDPVARRRYREHMAFASALHAEALAVGQIEGRTPGLAAAVEPRRVFARSLLAAAAVLAMLAAVASWIVVPRPEPAQITAGPATSWHFAAGGVDGRGRLAEGSRVVVAAGTLEIASPSGTRVLLEGPADFEWERPLEGELHEGQAWFAVARDDVGLRVRLGAVEVIDLGTEFGLRRQPGRDEIHVGVGRVRVESVFDRAHAVELRADEAVVAGPTGRTAGIPCRPGNFTRQIVGRVPMIRWSFDAVEDGRFPAQAEGLPAHPMAVPDRQGRLREPVIVEGRFGGALDLAAGGFGARSDFAGFAGGVPRTVALWVRGKPRPPVVYEPTGRTLHPSLVRWGTGGGEGGKWQLAVASDGRLLSTQWGASWAGASLPEGRTAFDGEWHHLASVFTGRYRPDGMAEVIHYFNGERLPERGGLGLVPVNTLTDAPHSRSLSLGLQDLGTAESVPLPELVLDELVLIRHALDDSQIRELYQTNHWRPGGRNQPEIPDNP